MGLWREARGVGGQGHPDTLQPSFDHDDGDDGNDGVDVDDELLKVLIICTDILGIGGPPNLLDTVSMSSGSALIFVSSSTSCGW